MGATSTEWAADPGAVERFLRRIRWRLRVLPPLRTGIRHGLWLGVVALVLALLRPTWFVPALTAAGLWLLVVLLWSLFRGRSPVAALDRELAFSDGLSTWAGLGRESRGSPMGGWLGRRVATRIAELPPDAIAKAAPLSLGRARFLLPLFVLLLLLRLLAPFLPTPPAGLIQLPGAGAGGAGAGGGSGEKPDPEGAGGDARPEPSPPPAPDPQDEAEVEPEEPEPEQPKPLLQLPSEQSLLVPRFLDDGPRTKTLAPQVQVPVGDPGGQPPPRTSAQTGGAGQQAAPPPAAPPEVIERAAEAAQRSRHVPPAERPFVRRYFQKLKERGR